jgi:DNA-binding CsgD family transcriptional regulator
MSAYYPVMTVGLLPRSASLESTAHAPADEGVGAMPGGYIHTDDVRELLRLVGECRELLDAGESASMHLLEGLTRVTRAQVAIHVEGIIQLGAPPVGHFVVEHGWATESDRAAVWSYVTRTLCDADPVLQRVARALPGETVTLTRREAMNDGAWRMSEARNDVHRLAGIEDTLLSARATGAGSVRALVLKRSWGERPFDERERDLVQLVHSSCPWLFAPPTHSAGPAAADALSPREHETYCLLLTGAPEKHIAGRLGVSRHTAHDHVKAVYKKLGVTSRAELMARALPGEPSFSSPRPRRTAR